MPHAIIIDIDGTVAIKWDRDIYDYSKVYLDKPNQVIVNLIHNYMNKERIFVSWREDNCFYQTLKRLKDNVSELIEPEMLLMRKAWDMRCDTIVKKEIFDEHIRNKYYVEFCLDDREKVVDMWRKEWLVCLQVAEWKF